MCYRDVIGLLYKTGVDQSRDMTDLKGQHKDAMTAQGIAC